MCLLAQPLLFTWPQSTIGKWCTKKLTLCFRQSRRTAGSFSVRMLPLMKLAQRTNDCSSFTQTRILGMPGRQVRRTVPAGLSQQDCPSSGAPLQASQLHCSGFGTAS